MFARIFLEGLGVDVVCKIVEGESAGEMGLMKIYLSRRVEEVCSHVIYKCTAIT